MMLAFLEASRREEGGISRAWDCHRGPPNDHPPQAAGSTRQHQTPGSRAHAAATAHGWRRPRTTISQLRTALKSCSRTSQPEWDLFAVEIWVSRTHEALSSRYRSLGGVEGEWTVRLGDVSPARDGGSTEAAPVPPARPERCRRPAAALCQLPRTRKPAGQPRKPTVFAVLTSTPTMGKFCIPLYPAVVGGTGEPRAATTRCGRLAGRVPRRLAALLRGYDEWLPPVRARTGGLPTTGPSRSGHHAGHEIYRRERGHTADRGRLGRDLSGPARRRIGGLADGTTPIVE